MLPIGNDIIWIVVPVYNAQKWIRRCVRSIQKQTYTNWRLVLVNDGSKDQSGRICDQLAQKDSRLIVLHTPNGGAHQARINGVMQIGDNGYALFCDSDDELPPDALELLYREAVRTDADLVCGGTQRILRNIRLPQKEGAFIMEPKCYDHQQIMRDLLISCFGMSGFPVSLCAKLYRSSILKETMTNLGVAPKLFAEDLNVTLHLLPHIRKLSVVSNVVYRYRYGGGTSRFMPTFLEDNLLMYHIKLENAHLCTSERNVERLIAIELKNIIGTYLVMCEKFQTFPQGSLMREITYVCELAEVQDAMGRYDSDKSGIPGLGDAIRRKDHNAICDLIREQVRRKRKQDLVKKILVG